METAIQYYKNKLLFEIDPSDLFSALEAKENVIVIDARKEFAFEKDHIPGALNFPYKNIDAEPTTHFDKEKLYVVYYGRIGCNASTKGASLNYRIRHYELKAKIGNCSN